MIEKWTSNETSFKTVNYENTYSVNKNNPKINPFAPAPREINIVTNNEEPKIEDYMAKDEYRSVSLAGIKKHKKILAEKKTETSKTMLPKVVEEYMKSIVGSGKNVDFEKGNIVESLSQNKKWVDCVE